MVCTVSRIQFASELLRLFVSGHVTSRWWKYDCTPHTLNFVFTHTVGITRGHCATHHAERTLNSKCHHYCPLKNWYGGHEIKNTHTGNINQSEAAGYDLWKNLADKVAGQTCWNIPSYSWNIMRNQCKLFASIVNRYATAVHLPSTNAYQRIWQQRDTACVGCYCP